MVGSLSGVPWRAVVSGTAAAGVLMAAPVAWSAIPFGATLFTLGVALLAVPACFVLDEPAAEAVDAGPTTLRHRTVLRAVALLVPVSVGLAATASHELRSPLATAGWGLALQVLGCVALGATVAATLRRAGMAAPGDLAAVGVGATLMVVALAEPFARWVLIFLVGPDPWLVRTVLFWLATLAGCAVVCAVVTRDRMVSGLRL